MNEFTFRPAIRQETPVVIGLAGPSKSGKTKSSHRLAVGLSSGGKVAMINTEGPRGHQYADEFKYVAVDIEEPFTLKRYTEAIQEARKINPAVLIIDSVSHAHEGIGGMLDQHEKELNRLSGDNYEKRQKMTWAAWVKPKADEAIMINSILQMKCHVILCFRAKEKIKIIKGKEPENLGWQPIGSDRIHFETAFTLILPPHSKGTPDLSTSEFRDPYDKIIQPKQLDEELGRKLSQWALGQKTDSLNKGLINNEQPSEEQVKQDLKKAGMIEEGDQKIKDFRTNISQCETKADLTETFQKFIKDKTLSKSQLDEATNLANDRHKQLKK